MTYSDDMGAASYAGIVTIDTETPNHQGTTADSLGEFIQGYYDCRFHVSGSFTATYGPLSLSLDSGAGWHEYCVIEVSYIAVRSSWAAQFV